MVLVFLAHTLRFLLVECGGNGANRDSLSTILKQGKAFTGIARLLELFKVALPQPRTIYGDPRLVLDTTSKIGTKAVRTLGMVGRYWSRSPSQWSERRLPLEEERRLNSGLCHGSLLGFGIEFWVRHSMT